MTREQADDAGVFAMAVRGGSFVVNGPRGPRFPGTRTCHHQVPDDRPWRCRSARPPAVGRRDRDDCGLRGQVPRLGRRPRRSRRPHARRYRPYRGAHRHGCQLLRRGIGRPRQGGAHGTLAPLLPSWPPSGPVTTPSPSGSTDAPPGTTWTTCWPASQPTRAQPRSPYPPLLELSLKPSRPPDPRGQQGRARKRNQGPRRGNPRTTRPVAPSRRSHHGSPSGWRSPKCWRNHLSGGGKNGTT